MDPQFIVMFRGREIGRYPTAEWAVGAAQSVIDTELGARPDTFPGPPADLPQILWQPPPLHFPFDAMAYWRQQATRGAPQRQSAPIGNQQFQGASPPPVPPGPAPVYGGPPAPVRREPPPIDHGQAPEYDGPPPPTDHGQAPAYDGPPPPSDHGQAPGYGGPPAPAPPHAKRRWLGRQDPE